MIVKQLAPDAGHRRELSGGPQSLNEPVAGWTIMHLLAHWALRGRVANFPVGASDPSA